MFVAKAYRAVPLTALLILTFSAAGAQEETGRQQTGTPTAFFTEATATHLPVDRLSGLSMDAEAADVDQDGDLDLLIAHEFRPNILLLNDGQGRFTDASAGNLPRINRDSEDIAIADFDQDGDLDAVIVSEDDRTNEFYLNNGDASFTDANARLPVEGISNAVEAADFDGDGDLDVAIGNGGRFGEQNALLRNDGAGFFADASNHLPARSDTTQDLAVGDLDNDGDLDLAVANENDNLLLLNNGDGSFVEAAVPLRPGGEETRQAALGDMDADGDLDLFFANVRLFNRSVEAAQNRLLLNDGLGNYIDVTTRLPPDGDNSFDGAFVDLDGDGDLDLVTSNAFPATLYRAYRNDGIGRYSDATALFFPAGFSGEGFDLEAADFDGDGRLDLYFCSRGGTDRLLLGLALPTAIAQEAGPAIFALAQNTPNPFNAQTTIAYALDRPGPVRLDVFNVAGQHVRRLVTGFHAGGAHTVSWDGRDETGTSVGSGVYLYRLRVGDRMRSRRLVLLQ